MKPENCLQILGRIGDYVYQRVRPGTGNVPDDPTGSLQLRRHVPTSTSNTPAQQITRTRFAAATAAWHQLEPADKHNWNAIGAKKRISGYNAYISMWIKKHHTP
jgi:hypothetical protein